MYRQSCKVVDFHSLGLDLVVSSFVKQVWFSLLDAAQYSIAHLA